MLLCLGPDVCLSEFAEELLAHDSLACLGGVGGLLCTFGLCPLELDRGPYGNDSLELPRTLVDDVPQDVCSISSVMSVFR